MENTELATQPSRMQKLSTIEISDHGMVLRTFEDVVRIAQMASDSQLVQQGWNTADVTLVLLNALEIGMRPLQALASSYIVNQRVSIFGDAPKSLVEASGLMEDYEERFDGKPYDDDFTAVVTSKRKGRKPLTTTFSVGDAKDAGLWGVSRQKNGREVAPWILYKKRMLMWRARGYNLKDNFPDVFKGVAIRELEDEGQGFDHAKPARVVEPNFETKTEKPFQKSEKFGEKFLQMKETVRNATQPSDAELKARAKADLELAVENDKKTYNPNEPMRPSRSEVGPTEANAPVEAPEPPTKPVAPPKPPKPPKQAPPATDEGTRLYKLHVKLKEEGIDQTKFLLVLFDFGLLDPGIEREEISAGNVGLDKLDHKALDVAAKNWKQVLEEVAKL